MSFVDVWITVMSQWHTSALRGLSPHFEMHQSKAVLIYSGMTKPSGYIQRGFVVNNEEYKPVQICASLIMYNIRNVPYAFLITCPGAVVKAACLESWRSRVRTPLWTASFKETKRFFPVTRKTNQYCGEPPWPRGSVLDLRPPGPEFRILCLEGSVISLISQSSGGYHGPV